MNTTYFYLTYYKIKFPKKYNMLIYMKMACMINKSSRIENDMAWRTYINNKYYIFNRVQYRRSRSAI